MNPQVSVILTSYNRPRWVGRAIRSVLTQTFEDWELIVCDDGSDDETRAVLREARDSDSRIMLLFSDPTPEERAATVRYATVINDGVRNCARGQFITYLADDDWYQPTRLGRMVTLLNAGAQAVYGKQALCREDGTQFGTRHTQGVLTEPMWKVDLNSVMHTRQAFDAVDGWDDSIKPRADGLIPWRHADGIFFNKLGSAGFEFVPVPGGSTDCKRYHDECIDQRVLAGSTPWT